MINMEQYKDFKSVEKQKNLLTSEEFPEGPYGSPINRDDIAKNKELQEGQKFYRSFGYENEQLHEDLPRQMDDDQS
ncbi:hypothetical protein EKG37_00500 [Robertmurraya yapensis]|uniref:Cytosolic protein n=2 Tax=Bacillaceae TaxID=186817 RepID=A0A431WKX4_9BACI|nr:hypothetical protein EKG37_00500 [Bacillus yapensis]TKT05576.1 hypothetical protein FAR12_00500 [Bacillus yapensis]